MPGVGSEHLEARLRLVRQMQHEFVADHPSAAANEPSDRLRASRPDHADVRGEGVRSRRRTGQTARRLRPQPVRPGLSAGPALVERSVPFIEVSLGGANGIGWDTHTNNFETVRDLSQVLDAGWATLMDDLKERWPARQHADRLDGRVWPHSDDQWGQGQRPFPRAWTAVLGGGGIKGGQVIGKTSPGGETIEDRPVSVPDLLATVCLALGVDPTKANQSNPAVPSPSWTKPRGR